MQVSGLEDKSTPVEGHVAAGGGETTPQEEVSAAPESSGSEEVAETSAPHEAPEYQPNWRFKVMDSEREFDEFVKPLIKDKETEARFRDLYERAYGLDHVKSDRQALRDENIRFKQELEDFSVIKQDLKRLGTYLKNDDLESFFEAHQIPEEKVLQYAAKKYQLHQDPAALQQYQRERALAQRQYELEAENQRWQSYAVETAVSRKQDELKGALSDPIVQEAATAFDTRAGRQGAFLEEVINRGRMHYNYTKQDLSAREAVNQVLQLAGYAPGTGAGTSGYYPQNSPPQARGVSQAPSVQGQPRMEPPVIPNIRGRASTPVRKVPRSIADLRNMANDIG